MKTIGKDRFLRAGVLLLVMSALALAGETPKPSGLGNSASAPGPAEEAKPEAVLEPSLAAVMVHAQKTVLSPGRRNCWSWIITVRGWWTSLPAKSAL